MFQRVFHDDCLYLSMSCLLFHKSCLFFHDLSLVLCIVLDSDGVDTMRFLRSALSAKLMGSQTSAGKRRQQVSN